VNENRDESGAIPEALTRIILRPIASGLPQGFFAFGVGTCLTSAFELHWFPGTEIKTTAIVILAFVAPLELLSCSSDFSHGTWRGRLRWASLPCRG
jgi:hypothetical protein